MCAPHAHVFRNKCVSFPSFAKTGRRYLVLCISREDAIEAAIFAVHLVL